MDRRVQSRRDDLLGALLSHRRGDRERLGVRALTGAAAGIGIGLVLGLAGLWLTRWEPTARSLHYTPNRWLVLAVTLVVAVRVVYGFWRGWEAWQSSGGNDSFVAAFGIAGSLAAGGIVIGYYLAYAVGLRWRISQWQRRPLRTLS